MLTLLAVNWNADPFLIHIGNGGLRWYSLLFASGFFIGWYLFKWFFKREKVDLSLMDPLLISRTTTSVRGRASLKSSCRGRAGSPATEGR